MTKRTQKQRISYAEVDSDHDWPSSEDEGEVGARAGTSKGGKGKAGGRGRGGGDSSYGSAKPPKKKPRRSSAGTISGKNDDVASTTTKEPKKPKYNEDLLLQLPFDMLAEVCSHLDTKDLISLAKVSRDFRKLFLSSTTRSLWATKRRQDGYEPLEGMNELTFAHLLHGSGCQHCDALYARTTFIFRARLCDTCTREQFVTLSQVYAHFKDLHDETLRCLQTEHGFYRFADVEDVDTQLHDLEDEDDETRSRNQRLNFGTTRSRRRASAPTGEFKEPVAVKTFVEAKVTVLEKERKTVERVWERREELLDAEIEAMAASRAQERERERERTNRYAEELEIQYGWTSAQVDFYKTPWRRHRVKQSVPETAPADDVDGWASYQQAIQDLFDGEEAERQAQPGRQARRGVLRNLLNTLKDDLEDELSNVFPSFSEFQDLPEIRPLWHPADAELENETAAKKLPIGRTALRAFAERLRVEAIRQILSAQGNKPLRSFSSEPSAYPTDKYNEAFFTRITSLFFGTRVTGVYSRTKVALPFPACVPNLDSYGLVQYGLGCAISYKQVCAVRAVVKAAGLDEDTVTADDLDELGAAFKWPTCPRSYMRSTNYRWIQMVEVITRRGPGVKKLMAGATVELEFKAQDRKGKGKVSIFDDSDDDERLVGLWSDEEDVKPKIEQDESDDEGEEQDEDEDSDA
ncbi:hypothetical protein JCM6882_001392 [Rhodosporidiobolus microsporus]